MSTTAIQDETAPGRNELLPLLGALIFMLLVVPLSEHLGGGRVLMHVGLTLVLIAAAVAARHRRQILIAGLFVAAVAVLLNWLSALIDNPALFAVGCVVDSAFFVAIAVLILKSVVQKHLTAADSIYGAISAYLLIGLAWAMLYLGVLRCDAEAFSDVEWLIRRADSQMFAFSQLVYFSFVTMSTLGYGDIVPESPLTRTLAWMQSVCGLFYVAVVVAWVVSEMPSRQRTEE